MAKAKILADRTSITSDILTDENLEKVNILAPSTLSLLDDNTGAVLYEVTTSTCNTFTMYGASFKDGKSVGAISDSIMSLETAEKEKKVRTYLTAILTKINMIEEQVSNYLDAAEDIEIDVDFLD